MAELAHPARIRDLLLTKADSGDGQSFHVVSERAMTLRGYAEAVAAWFGQQAKVRYLPVSEFRRMTPAEHADLTWAHIARSASMSIDRARRLLGYRPRYTSLQAIADAVATASWRSRTRARRTHRLTPTSPGQAGDPRGGRFESPLPPGSNNGRCGPRTGTITYRSCAVARPNGSRQCVSRWFVSPATGFDPLE